MGKQYIPPPLHPAPHFSLHTYVNLTQFHKLDHFGSSENAANVLVIVFSVKTDRQTAAAVLVRSDTGKLSAAVGVRGGGERV